MGQRLEIYEGLDPLGLPKMGRNLALGMYIVAITQDDHTEVVKVNKIYR